MVLADMVLAEDFTFGHFLLGVLYLFGWIILFWLIITVLVDLFRRHDESGWTKALWVILVVILPFIGVLLYLITQGPGMARRNQEQAEHQHDALRQAVGFSAADEIEKLERLKRDGKLSDDEYQRMRAKLVG